MLGSCSRSDFEAISTGWVEGGKRAWRFRAAAGAGLSNAGGNRAGGSGDRGMEGDGESSVRVGSATAASCGNPGAHAAERFGKLRGAGGNRRPGAGARRAVFRLHQPDFARSRQPLRRRAGDASASGSPTAPAVPLELERRFKAAGIQGVAVENLEKSQWEKLVWNIPFNGLSVAEGGVTTDVLLAYAGNGERNPRPDGRGHRRRPGSGARSQR